MRTSVYIISYFFFVVFADLAVFAADVFVLADFAGDVFAFEAFAVEVFALAGFDAVDFVDFVVFVEVVLTFWK